MKKANETVSKELVVENARVVTYKDNESVLFTLVVNGVTIYNCKVVEGSKGDFISFPQTKDKNNKYWNVAYVKLTDEETAQIIADVEELINK